MNKPLEIKRLERTPQDILKQYVEKNPNQLFLVAEVNGQLTAEINFKSNESALLMLFLLRDKVEELVKNNLKDK